MTDAELDAIIRTFPLHLSRIREEGFAALCRTDSEWLMAWFQQIANLAQEGSEEARRWRASRSGMSLQLPANALSAARKDRLAKSTFGFRLPRFSAATHFAFIFSDSLLGEIREWGAALRTRVGRDPS